MKKLLNQFFPLRKELPTTPQEISAVDPALTLELQREAPKFFAFLTSKHVRTSIFLYAF